MRSGYFKDFCTEAWKNERYDFFKLLDIQMKGESKYCIYNERMKTYINCIQKQTF